MIVEELIMHILEDYKTTDNIEIKAIYAFENGNVAVFDQNDKQVAFLQGLLRTNTIHIQGG